LGEADARTRTGDPFRDAAGYWRWTFYAPNNRKLADSAEGYVNRADCEHGITLVKQYSGGAPTV
jgi:uncharacterized protein YegP (UPF0339 family)